MKRGYFLFICLFLCWAGCAKTNVEVSKEETEQQDDDAPMIWIGPGWYYGIWFDSEYDFDDWHRNHNHRDYHHDHDGHHQPHGQHGPRGGGGRRGGGGGHRR